MTFENASMADDEEFARLLGPHAALLRERGEVSSCVDETQASICAYLILSADFRRDKAAGGDG